MASRGRRIGVLGATGALGSEVLAALDRSPARVAEIVPYASDRSLGDEIEFQGRSFPVRTGSLELRGLDLLFLCAPASVSVDGAREALRAEVPALDASGAFAANAQVPVALAAFGAAFEGPLAALPAGPALALALVLRPLAEVAGLRRVGGVVLEAASLGGKRGIGTLYSESVAIFGNEELPEPEVFARPAAFDCLPAPEREEELAARLGRVLALEPAPAVGLGVVQVPIFVGQAAALEVETQRPLTPEAAEAALAGAARVELWRDEDGGPTPRTASGRDAVLVGRVRGGPPDDVPLRLWLVCDPLALAAAEAVALALPRLDAARPSGRACPPSA